MNVRHLTVLMGAGCLVACAPYEGKYEPGCTAYAGSVVSLEGSDFVWEKFTDQVRIDEEGKVIDAYPDYPKQGSYRKSGSTLYLETTDGEAVATMYLHKYGESYLLLTVEEHEAWERSGEYGACALKRGGAESS